MNEFLDAEPTLGLEGRGVDQCNGNSALTLRQIGQYLRPDVVGSLHLQGGDCKR